MLNRRSATKNFYRAFPGLERPGYVQSSLRD
jgi:hypothetical protein